MVSLSPPLAQDGPSGRLVLGEGGGLGAFMVSEIGLL